MNETPSLSSAVAEFRQAAMSKGDGVGLSVERDHALHAEMSRAVGVMKAYGDEGRAALRRLTDDPSPHVRAWAAAELLSRGDTSVIPLLEALASERGLVRLSSEMVLREYRAGRFRSPFPSPAP